MIGVAAAGTHLDLPALCLYFGLVKVVGDKQGVVLPLADGGGDDAAERQGENGRFWQPGRHVLPVINKGSTNGQRVAAGLLAA